MWIFYEEFEILDLVDFGGVTISVESVISYLIDFLVDVFQSFKENM